MPESRYNQSPMLNQRVMDGTLPPVDERLPLNPVVITPRADLGESVGKYGGTLTVMAIDPTMTPLARNGATAAVMSTSRWPPLIWQTASSPKTSPNPGRSTTI